MEQLLCFTNELKKEMNTMKIRFHDSISDQFSGSDSHPTGIIIDSFNEIYMGKRAKHYIIITFQFRCCVWPI